MNDKYGFELSGMVDGRRYLRFDTNVILDHTAREGAADGKTLEHRSDGVAQTESQQLLKSNIVAL